MDDCIFCKIASGLIPSKKVYEDENALAFYDVAPQAPVHVLVIPKTHTPNVAAYAAEDPERAGALFTLAARLASDLGVKEEGFRLITNCGKHGAQSVDHFHIHILGGAQLSEKLS